MTQQKSKLFQGSLFLLLAAMLWGGGFIFQKLVSETIPTFLFNGIRFGIAAVALVPLLKLPQSFLQSDVNAESKKQYAWFVAGGISGVFMFIAISLQQWGIAYTTAGKSGFITSFNIVLVPILALFLKRHCGIEVWLGAFLSLIGLYFLSSSESKGGSFNLNIGDFLTFLSAWGWALQVLWLSSVARYNNPIRIAIAQSLVVFVLSFIGLFMQVVLIDLELPSLGVLWQFRLSFLYASIVAVAIAFTAQIIGQRHVPAANAAIIMSLESVFAMVSGVLFLNEVITLPIFIGCSFIFFGVVIAQIGGFLKQKRQSQLS